MSGAPGDTIAAIATARGRAALAVIRLSGPDAVRIAASRFAGKDLTSVDPQTMHFGRFVSEDGIEVDQVVASVFRAPRSATGEDLVEFSCHGGDFAPRLVLGELVGAGARMAEPGEFTLRGFLNGKLDLAQAEAVADLIHASSTLAHRTAVSQLEGRYSEVLSFLRSELLELCAFVELELDFSEEDVEFADRDRMSGLLSRVEEFATSLLESYRTGAMIRDGIRVVIAGRPNAGKSTLLNALLGRDRAIVSDTPGTTRDEIEAELEIEGLLFRFVDTAGLREAADLIEAEGVRRAHSSISGSDVLLYVYDLHQGIDLEESRFLLRTWAENPATPVVVVGNKADLDSELSELPEDLRHLPSVQVSALQGLTRSEETAEIVRLLIDVVGRDLSDAVASPVVVNERHRRHLEKVVNTVRSATASVESGVTGDVLAIDLRTALQELGAITGEITNEDVLDQIFSRFCIGK
ncbi:MAG: tRNA uridine-5-carboxymethylaminomethyl(34) synthesis GTPase MnmE [Rhodothermia bacterium]|nr:tRNA uridine-5-carboxymethylaminomethyl(34) synthesis GTPase MnmE [Rhodothermia bacterium]